MAENTTKTNYTARELAGLPGMPNSERGVQKLAERESWPFQKRAGRGGGREYPITALPAETRDHLLDRMVASLPEKTCNLPVPAVETLPAVVEPAADLPAITTLKKWQVEAMDARIYFMRLIEQAEGAGLGITQAIRRIVRQAAEGTLPDEAQAMVVIANKRSGKDTRKRTLSETSLMRWWSTWLKKGKRPQALAPKSVERDELPAWAPYFLQVYRVPQKISVAHAIEDLAAILPPGVPMPSEHQARRFMKKHSRLEIQKGRMTGKELKSLKGFIRRDTSEFLPLDICLCDGHSFKADVAHPVHGRPFKPEVCAVIDAVTRVCTGWSSGLAESSQTVADAYRHAVTVNDEKRYGGIPAILYADKGAGNEARVNSDPFSGMYARIGSTYRTGIPGNSQARGRIEKMQDSLWIRAAKKLPTYSGRGMDEQVRRKVYLTMERDVKQALKEGKEGKKSALLLSWQEFLDFCQAEVEAYNRRPHSALPRIADPETGLRRHMCPLEMWSQFLAEGWTPELPEPTELEALFRPHVTVTTRRCEVRLFGNIYYAPELVHYGGETVIVAYDIHDANQVWVKDLDERLIAIARWNANKQAFYPVPAVEKAREDRKNRRKKTLERHLDEIEAEAAAPVLVEYRELPPEVIAFEERLEEKEKEKKENRKRFFNDITEVYDDIRARQKQGLASEYEITWADDKDRSGARRVGLYKDDPECAGRFRIAK
ncbi:transposase [bacterium]|nr:transposase [bacterium]